MSLFSILFSWDVGLLMCDILEQLLIQPQTFQDILESVSKVTVLHSSPLNDSLMF